MTRSYTIFLPLFLLLLAADAPEAPPAPLTPKQTPAIAELVTLAEKTALPTPMTILCFGDSITATHDKQPIKYPEMLQHALTAHYGDNIRVINAGKGGDNTGAAPLRLQADVLDHKPDLVFINLGVNDSKLARPNYERNAIAIDTYKDNYDKLLTAIQDTGSRPIVVGTIACVDEWTIRTTQQENKGNWFGKPEELIRYNAVARELATTHKTEYVDLYDHFRAQPDMTSFFTEPDGVHCRDLGQEQIALQLMRFLAKAYPAPEPAAP